MAKRRAKDPLLSVPEVADEFGTSERFVRRLIAERRIDFVRLGRHVRIKESVVRATIAAGTVEAIDRRRRGRGRVA
jgi:excisionase family DNA binding protein